MIYVAVAIGANLFFLLSNINAFDIDIRYYVYRPNEYVDVYNDWRSRHWLGITKPIPLAGRQRLLRAAPRPGSPRRTRGRAGPS